MLCDMLVMEGGAPANVAGGASIHAYETAQKPLAHLGFIQAMALLYFAPQEAHECNDSIQEETTQCEKTAKVIIRMNLHSLSEIATRQEQQRLAPHTEKGPLITKDKSVISTDCCASSTSTGSLINTTDVGARITIIKTADGKESIRVSYNCLKSYYVQNRMREVTKMTIPALYVKGLSQDLLRGKCSTRRIWN
jgi:hypothetical protein